MGAFTRTNSTFLLTALAVTLGSTVGCDLSRSTTSPTAVQSAAPVPGFTTMVNGRNVTVTTTAVGATTWSYDWGDNSSDAFPAGSGSHFYNNDGVFTIVQIVTNTSGSASTSKSVVVGDPDPVPIAAFEIVNVTGLFVSFANRSSCFSSQPCTNFWRFGDGETDTLESPDHRYRNGGTYTVILRVCNPSNECNSTDQNVTVL